MASLRIRQRKDGSTYTSVLYVLNGKQTSISFNDHAEALRFQELANRTSPAKAREVWATQAPGTDGFTVASWCTHHVDHLTGINGATRRRYGRYIANDIAPSNIGPLPLTALTNADVAQWLNSLTGAAKNTGQQAWVPGGCPQRCSAGPAHLGQPLRRQSATPRRARRDGVPHP